MTQAVQQEAALVTRKAERAGIHMEDCSQTAAACTVIAKLVGLAATYYVPIPTTG